MTADFSIVLDACVLANFGVCDLFLRLALYSMNPVVLSAKLAAISRERELDVEDTLIQLGKSVPRFSAQVLADMGEHDAPRCGPLDPPG